MTHTGNLNASVIASEIQITSVSSLSTDILALDTSTARVWEFYVVLSNMLGYARSGVYTLIVSCESSMGSVMANVVSDMQVLDLD